ncbi:MAG: protein disulfide oxidoreductase [Gallionella sp.]
MLLVALVAGMRAWQHRDIVSGAAPALQGTVLTGSKYELPAHPQRPVLVHFWATWCPICRAEQGTIDAISDEQGNVITVAMQSGRTDLVANHMQRQELRFPVINDPESEIAARWGVHAVPASFIVAPDGTIEFIEVGYTTGIGLRLRLWWAGI